VPWVHPASFSFPFIFYSFVFWIFLGCLVVQGDGANQLDGTIPAEDWEDDQPATLVSTSACSE